MTFDYPSGEPPDPGALERQRLVHLVAAFQQFAGHEVPNALVPIQAFARMLLDEHADRVDAEGRDLLTRVAELARRLDTTARRLADVSRLLAEPVWGPPVSLDAVADEAAAEVKVLLAPGAVIEVERPLGTAAVSAAALQRLLVHLLHNAARAARRVGGAVRLSCRREPGGLTLCVHDPGPGPEPAAAGRLGKPFLAGRDGPGLGLFLACQLAARWGGRFTLRSESGQGTAALVYIPDRQPPPGGPSA